MSKQPPFQFKPTPGSNIPIVGQPFEVKGWLIQVLLVCKCETPQPILLIGLPGQAAAQCPSCKRIFGLTGLGMAPNGDMQFQIGQMVKREEAATDEASKN